MDAEFSRGVGGRGNHAAFVGTAPHHHGLAFEGRIEKLLDGDEEGVHVEVEEAATAYRFMAVITRGIPAKSGLIPTLVHSPSIALTLSAANQPISRIR
jgi:hypothetical protein